MKRLALEVPCLLVAGLLLYAPSAAWAQRPAVAPATRAAAPDLQWTQQYLDQLEQSLSEMEALRSKAAPAEEVAKALQQGLSRLGVLQQRLDDAQKAATKPSGKADATALEQAYDACRCRAAIGRGQLYMQAAAALPQSSGERANYAAKAIETFQVLRVDYRQLRLGGMGYILESRAQRLVGKPEAAVAALDPLLGLLAKETDPVSAEMRQMATVERLEAQSLQDPSATAAEAAKRLSSVELKDKPQWQGQVNWVLARARLGAMQRQARLDQPPAKDAVQQCAALLRNEEVVKAASPRDRLKCLVELEAMAREPLLRRQELLDWAQALEQAGQDGTAVYERVLKSGQSSLTPGQALQFCAALYRRQKYEKAAQNAQLLLEQPSLEQPARQAALQLRAAALLAMRQASALPAERLGALLEALLAVVESDLPQQARYDALSQWAGLQPSAEAAATVLQVLDKHNDLVAQNAYLLHAAASRRWTVLCRKLADGAATQEDKAQAERILDDAARAQELAKDDKRLSCWCALLRAQMLGQPPTNDARAALALLKEHQQDFDADKSLSPEALRLRVRFMVDLGMMDAAAGELGKAASQGAGASADVLLRLAEALAQRYATAERASRARLSQQAIDLCNSAMEQSVKDGAAYREASRRAAAILTSVGALSDAHRVVTNLLADPVVAKDKPRSLSLSLLLAQILVKDNKAGQALATLDNLAKTNPQSLAVQSARGNCQMLLQQPQQAAESFRAARKLAKPGSQAWCRLTLDLAHSLAAQDKTDAAADILRVALALYPDFSAPALRARCIADLRTYSPTATTQVSGK